MTEPWKAEALDGSRFRFTNISGRKLVMITLTPKGGTVVQVEDALPIDPHAVPAPVDAGKSFTAEVRGPGVRITATVPPSMQYAYWDFTG